MKFKPAKSDSIPNKIGRFLYIVFLLALGGLQVVSAQITLPSCTTSINFPDDNDGVAQAVDIDKDNNGLIEICDLEGIDEMRYALDGTGYKMSDSIPIIMTGCPPDGCRGFELTRSLDFMDNDSYRTIANKTAWTTDQDWQPIGNSSVASFGATFEGNGYTISNLTINKDRLNGVGLFGITESEAEITNLGLLNVDIEGQNIVGGLVGRNHGAITHSYATGNVGGNDEIGGLVGTNTDSGIITSSYATGNVNGNDEIGGLVGLNRGAVTNSYATGDVNGKQNIGGLAGLNDSVATITNSYAIGSVPEINTRDDNPFQAVPNIGGLVGRNSLGATITNSYATGRAISRVPIQVRQTAEALKSPTTATGIYSNWSTEVWDFGTSDQFPVLKDADSNTLLPNQGVGLRELELLTVGMTLSPTFGVSTTHYVIAFFPLIGTTPSIVLRLRTYHPDATIEIVKQGEDPAIDYFVGKGGSGTSNPIAIGDNTMLNITVGESDGSIISYSIVASLAMDLPLCTTSLRFADDNDGIFEDTDIDKDNDGLIEICDLEGVDEMRYALDGTGYKMSDSIPIIMTGCPPDGCRGFELTRSLDFMDNDSYRTIANKTAWTTDHGWQPIGNSSVAAFDAAFEGNGYTISNLTINKDRLNEVGLFGITESEAEITNLGLLNVDIEGQNVVGGLVGWNQGTITNSYATGDVTEGLLNLGGLVGQNHGAITHSYAKVNFTGSTFDSTGGLVGINTNLGTITNSYATGNVNGNDEIGGLVGINTVLGSITNSYATGNVNGNDEIGGLVGINTVLGTITNSYATGNVNGNDKVGGLVGINTDSGTITNSYATGNVNGRQNIGGLAGLNDSVATITNSYAIGNRGTGVPIQVTQTAEALKSPTTATGIYSNWSTEVWDFGTSDQFPILKDADSNTLFPSQGVGLRELEILTVDTRLNPTFGVSTTHYVITFLPLIGTTRNIVLRLTAYNPDATIKIVKQGENPVIDYFSAKGSHGESNPITIGNNTILDITVGESDSGTVSYSIVGSFKVNLPLCTFFLRFADDNDGVARAVDIDKDNDGLIEICDLEGVDEMRHVLDGTAYKTSENATVIMTGCPLDGCRGFELTRSLDFMDNDSYRTIANKMAWTAGSGWQPIGNSSVASFDATFEGNGYTISNLTINKNRLNGVGLFGITESEAEITNLGLLNIDIEGQGIVGGLVGWNRGIITNSHATGDVTGGLLNLGGLVGRNHGAIIHSYATVNFIGSTSYGTGGLVGINTNLGTITNSYATGNVSGNDEVGGLVGINTNLGTITNSYATGNVSGNDEIGGLVGINEDSGTITNSYAMGNVNGNDKVGGLVGINTDSGTITNSYAIGNRGTGVPIQVTQTAEALKSPTTATGIYSSWSLEAWDFGTDEQYPAVKYALGDNIGNPACDADPGTPLPDCGSLLPGQREIPNTTPTITTTFPPSITLLEGDSTTLNVVVSDVDGDEPSVEIDSDDSTIAAATIVATDGDTRTIEIIGVGVGTAMITVTANDGKGVANSEVSRQFEVEVEANKVPVLEIVASPEQAIEPSSTVHVVVLLSDSNFDLGDIVTLVAMSSSRTIVSVVPGRTDNITADTRTTFTLGGDKAGMATIIFTATDRKGASTNTEIVVQVNTPPQLVSDRVPERVIATVGEPFELKTGDFFEDADGDALTYSIAIEPSSRLIDNFSTATGIWTFTPTDANASRNTTGSIVTVSVDDGSGGSTQATFTLLIDAPPTALRIAADNDNKWLLHASGLVADANGIATTSYRWFMNDNLIDGATENEYSIPDTKASRIAATSYRLEATVVDNIGQSVTTQSNVYTVANQSPVIESITDTQTIDETADTQNIDVGVTASDANYDDLTYSWSINTGILNDVE